jgi:uroporphyrin-III C-methyltransferase
MTTSHKYGSVTLVGAGPGDPELLTLKAVRAIASASVILVDDLVNEAVLEHAQTTARVIYVGKRGGCKSTAQADIEAMMIAEAMRGETVIRLKGGDPMIFGRAGEELAALSKAGIACSVVNGITAGLAAATALAMPLTHRDHAHGVVFVTGHPQAGGQSADWVALGDAAHTAKLTVVIYMGMSQAANIQSGLLTHMPPGTSVALVQNASSPHERRALTQLQHLNFCIEQEQLTSPLVMIIGDVATAAAADIIASRRQS